MRAIFIILIILLINCENKNQEVEVISRKKFVQIYCDVISKADLLLPKEKDAFVDSILAHYDVSHNSFENTIQTYNKNPEEWKEVFEKIIEELNNRLEIIEADTVKSKYIFEN